MRGEDPQTHFSRACKELGVKIIYALSPQAKGRIERSFGTFQDRLIKEMRLEGIGTMQEANEFLKRYLPIHNKRFGKEPLKRADLHRPLPRGIKLKDIFCIKGIRTITNDYTVRWGGGRYLIQTPSIAIRRRKVEVREHFDGKITMKFNGRYLKNKEVRDQKPPERQKVKKEASELKKRKTKYIPPADHPWRRHQPSLHYNSYLERVI